MDSAELIGRNASHTLRDPPDLPSLQKGDKVKHGLMREIGIKNNMAVTIKALGQPHMVLPNRQSVHPKSHQLGPTVASKMEDRKVVHVRFLLKNQSGSSIPSLW